MNKNNEFVKNEILNEGVETEEVKGKLHIVGIALMGVVIKQGTLFLYTSVKTIALILIYAVTSTITKSSRLPKQSEEHLYNSLADNFDKTNKSVTDPKDRESIKDLIKSNKIELAQTLIKNYKNIKNVK